jgi:hypothetical protein
MLERSPAHRVGGTRRADGAHRDHSEKEALRILHEGIRHLGLPTSLSGLACLRKSDDRKAQLAILLRTHTTVSNDWIAAKLAMGHPGSVSRVVSAGKADKSMTSKLRPLKSVLIREQ